MLGNRQGHSERALSMSNTSVCTEGPAGVTSRHLTDRDLESIYRDHYPRFVRLAYSLVGRRDIAEELVQEAFIQANQKWRSISQYDDPTGWVRRVLVNRCTDTLRRSGTERRALGKVGADTDRRSTATDRREPSPDDPLWTAVRSLPDQQAAVIALVYLEDLDINEVASALTISEHTARTHLQRAKARLAGLLIDQAPSTAHSKELS
jgi:RNA polymerase sigma-70 factor, ECF subfamily